MPLPIPNVEARQRSKMKQYLGSFWNSTFANPDHILALSNMPRQTSMIGDLKALVYNLAGQHDLARKKTFITVPFQTDQIIQTGSAFFDDPKVTRKFGTSDNDSALNFNFYRIPYNALYMGPITPVLIKADGRTLALGIDFFLDGDFIFFRQNPRDLFPNGNYAVTLGIDTGYRPIVADLIGANVPEYQDLMIQYVKKYQTPGWFRLAASAAAGMCITRHTQKLLDIQTSDYATVYIFEQETIRVDYDHTPLTVGSTYPEHYVIGDGLKIIYGDPSIRWWRQVDWHGGISLDPLIPGFKGVQLPDQDTYAFVAGSDPMSVRGSQAHVRLDLHNPDWQRESAYWDFVAEKETLLGFYLNNVIGLKDAVDSCNPAKIDTFAKLKSANEAVNLLNEEMGWPIEKPDYEILPDKLMANSLDTFFQAVLGAVAVVVYVDPTRIGDPEGLYQFLSSEMVPDATPVIVAFPPALAGENLDNTTGSVVTDSAAFYPFDYLVVTETVDASSIITDSVVFDSEVPWLNIN